MANQKPHHEANQSPPSLPASPDSPPVRWWRRTWTRLTVCFLFVATVPLAITAIYTTQRHLTVVRAMAAHTASERAAAAAGALGELLEATANDTLSVAEWPVLQSFMSLNNDSEQETFWRDKLKIQLQTFMELNSPYRSISLADTAGSDFLRMVRRGTATQVTEGAGDSAAPFISDALGAATTLLPRQTLWRVNIGGRGNTSGTLEADSALQHKAITCAARVPRSVGHDSTIVVVELDVEEAFQFLKSDASDRRVIVFDEARRVVFDSFAEETADLPHAWSQQTPGQFVDNTGRLVSATPVASATGPEAWLVSVIEPATVLEVGVADYRAGFLAVLIGSLLVAIGLGVWISMQVTKPVGKLYDASRRIGKGDFDVSLPEDAGDELGALTQQVGWMASQIRESHASFEERLQAKTEELLQADRLATIGRTAAAVAHEINNPSGIITLYAQMLTERLPPDDQNISKVRVIESKAREISRIVRELLDYARKPAPTREWTDVRSLVQGAVEEATCVNETESTTASIETTVEIAEDVTTMQVDPHQVSRVVRNLVTNALHAMPEGGSLRIACRSSDTGGVVMEIADTGVGISPEHVGKLFNPFHTTKRFGAGTGLGLAISKEIVQRHGGRIEVTSQVGMGTTFTVWIPNGK